MVAQPHAAPVRTDAPGRRPITAPALRPPQSLSRLLAVVLLTVSVVIAWSLRDDDAPPSAGSQAITVIGADAPAAPVDRISLPQGAATAPIQGPVATAVTAGDSTDLPRLRPNALPRPPEPADPIQPGRFVRFVAQPGDTVYDVSIVYGVSIDEILRFNPTLGDGTQIVVGQVIFVPAD